MFKVVLMYLFGFLAGGLWLSDFVIWYYSIFSRGADGYFLGNIIFANFVVGMLCFAGCSLMYEWKKNER